MKLTITFLLRAVTAAFLLLFMTTQTSAQDSCTFRLRVYDQFGDGWDESQVYIRMGTPTSPERSYTHGGVNINFADSVRFFNIRVRTGDSIWIRYEAQGIYQNEIRYSLIDNTGVVLFSAGPNPVAGPIVYRNIIKCRNCGSPLALTVPDIRTTSATARRRNLRCPILRYK